MSRDSGVSVELPRDWTFDFRDRNEEVRAGDIPLYRQGVRVPGESLAMLFWTEGLAPWGIDAPRIGPARIRLDRFPALDDVWTLWLWAFQEKGGDPKAHGSWQKMCRYVGDVRRGHWPDAEPLEHSVQGVFSALRMDTLAREPRREDEFLNRVFELLDCVAGELDAGKAPHKDDMLGDHAEFAVYFEHLRNDRNLYREALARAERFWAQIPPDHHAGREPRRVPLLVLRDPIATQYKVWARRDPDAPGGAGYPLLLVEELSGRITLSADPASKLRVDWLAAPLSEKEASQRGAAAPWFDGRDPQTGEDRFLGTVCAYPDGGTILSMQQVIGVLRSELSLVPLRDGSPKMSAAVGAVAFVLIALFLLLDGTNGPPLKATKGAPLDAPQVAELLASSDGPASPEFRRYALLVGASRYGGTLELTCPPNDVRDLRRLLIEHYGYRPQDVTVLVDAGELRSEAAKPSKIEVFKALEDFRYRIGSERSSFLFYYSGHGQTKSGENREYGILQFPEYFRQEGGAEVYAWDMDSILEKLRDYVKSNHLMLVLDCCFSGWVGEVKPGELEPAVTEHWSEPGWSALTAGRRTEKATEYRLFGEGGHGALTHCVLEALQVGETGRPAADANRDFVVTDEELAAFVSPAVTKLVRRHVQGVDQNPTFARLDVHEPLSAKFLFVPATATASSGR